MPARTVTLVLPLLAVLVAHAGPVKKAKCDCTRPPDMHHKTPVMDFLERTLQRHCDFIDPTMCLEPEGIETVDADFVVVGAGSAGSVTACRLSESGRHRVALLEAGGPAPAAASTPSLYHSFEHSSIDWNFVLEKDPNCCLAAPCYWPRGRVVGGTSVLHGMMYMRGHPWDYEHWAASGAKGWAWADVLPYFMLSEDNVDVRKGSEFADPSVHGTSGPLTVQRFNWQPALTSRLLAAASQLGFRVGHDANGAAGQLGFTVAQATTVRGARPSLLRDFCGGSVRRPNLRIHTKAQVTRILVDPTTKRALGVEYIQRGKLRRIMAKKEVILSAGTVGSPHILLLSGIGPKEHLQKIGIPVIHNLPGVGRYLQNHVSYKLRIKLDNWRQEAVLNNATLDEYLRKRTGPLSATGLSQLTGFVRTKYAPLAPADLPDLQIFFAGEQANGSSAVTLASWPTYIDIVPTLLRPQSRGFIELRSKDPLQPPRIYARYFSEIFDLKVLVEGIKFVLDFIRTPIMQELGASFSYELTQGCEDFGEGTDDFWACAIQEHTGPENHQVGTCHMGDPLDPTAVVSPSLKVIGIQGLRVIDASVIPHVTSGNVNAPIIMVAERGSQMILNDWS